MAPGQRTRRADGSHRVVVTGLGAVSGFGVGVGLLWQGIASAGCAIRPVRCHFEEHAIEVPAALADYVAEAHFDGATLQICDRFAQLGIIAAREAIADAGLGDKAGLLDGTGAIVGCGSGGELSREEAAIQLFHRHRPRCHPMTVPRINHQAVVSHIAAEHGLHGPALVIATGCAAGSHAIAQAVQTVRHGYAERVLAGGTEASVTYSLTRAFAAARTVARDTCRPFSAGRSGFAFGDGAGMLVVETLEAALRRGAPIRAEISGFGLSVDGSDQVQPTVAGPARALQIALADAGLAPCDIGYISAHGTATLLNDVVETRVIKQVFGDHARRLLISSTKSQIGHCFGAAGALEAIVTIRGMEQALAPPTVNYLGPDPECDLDYVVNAARAAAFTAAVSQSFAFGGLNAALVVQRGPDGEPLPK